MISTFLLLLNRWYVSLTDVQLRVSLDALNDVERAFLLRQLKYRQEHYKVHFFNKMAQFLGTKKKSMNV